TMAARGGETVGEHTAGRAGADDDVVVGLRHRGSLPFFSIERLQTGGPRCQHRLSRVAAFRPRAHNAAPGRRSGRAPNGFPVTSTESEKMSSGVLTQRNIGIDLALECAQAALATARTRGYRVAVAVADRGGQLMVLLRSDGAGPHLIDSARRKAYTAASMRNRTSIASKAIDERRGEPDPHLVHLEGVLVVGGGVPIKVGDEVIGAIGVGGSPASIHDQECAEAGIAQIAARLTCALSRAAAQRGTSTQESRTEMNRRSSYF